MLDDIEVQRNCIDSVKGVFCIVFFLDLHFGKITEPLCFCDPTWKAESADLTFILSPYLQYITALKMYCFFLPSQFCYNTRCRLIEGENRIRFPVSILQPPIFFF